jgi:nucleotide-binding universal stress UspA family protein
MKKILLVYNGETVSEHVTDFGIELSKQTGALLHGVFVSPFPQQINQYPFAETAPFAAGGLLDTQQIQREHVRVVKSNMGLFVDSCQEAGVNFTVDDDIETTITELTDHSAFADLVLFSAKEQIGSYSFREIITDTHCPVILVPEKAQMPQRTILCYDESFSSIYAIKMYSYLFPEWQHLPTYLLSINPKGDNGNKFDGYLEDWLPAHFSNIEKIQLEGNLQKELLNYVKKDDKHSMLVMGAFGGNAIARMFHRSLANVVLEETSASVFIIHE